MKTFIIIVIVIALFSLQYFLSKRKSALFGGILPILVIPFAIWTFNVRSFSVSSDTILPFVGLFIVLISIWCECREKIKKKQKEELDKMKAKDIE